MTDWIYLTDEQRLETLQAAARESGIGAKALEKDWWVTVVLKALFTGQFRTFLVFKGGTSLSKGWDLIERFSEDIDIVLDPRIFEMPYQAAPTKSYVEKLKKTGYKFTTNEIKVDLEQSLDLLGLPSGTYEVMAEDVDPVHTDKDPQVLYVKFKSLLEPNPYLTPPVKVEIGVRSDREPWTVCHVQSLLTTYFPSHAYAETPFEVGVIDPEKNLHGKNVPAD